MLHRTFRLVHHASPFEAEVVTLRRNVPRPSGIDESIMRSEGRLSAKSDLRRRIWGRRRENPSDEAAR